MLTVSIFSFSYKGGYPLSTTLHGGGFVFDCRFIQNPGRIPEFKAKSGKDREIVEYLNQLEEAADFKKRIFAIVDEVIKNYLKRDFTDLEISFGCTGGQHRSVYFSEALFCHLEGKDKDVKVTITHRDIK